jgi:hypothetical protein
MRANGTRPPGHRDERYAAASPVECARCGAAVLAVKFSPQHTSVQWTAAAVRACAEFGASDRPSALVEGCASLRDSLEGAVAAGRLEVSPPWYERADDHA